jgi:predicted SprT family Zn-dependent metalloprotease
MRQLDFLQQLAGVFRKVVVPTAPAPPAVTEGVEATARALLGSIGCTALAAVVRVVWNPRMRSTAGLAYPRQNLVKLNPRLCEFGAAEIDRTLRHELAHLLAHHRAGRRRIAPHGPEWAQACRDLGLVDEQRCHDLPLPRRKMPPRHAYRCPHCGTVLQRVRPLRGKSACLACCRRHSGGSYDERFRFVRMPAARS